MLFYFSLIIILIIMGASAFSGRSSLAINNKSLFFRRIFIFSVIFIFGYLIYLSYQQYQNWSQGEISKFFLSPHQSISYFIFYVGTRFFAPYLLSLLAAVLFIFAAKKYNQKYEERFFYPEEYWFGGVSIFLASYPGTLFYIVFILAIAVVLSLIVGRWSLIGERLSLYYFWPVAAIFTILITEFWLKTLPWWGLLKI